MRCGSDDEVSSAYIRWHSYTQCENHDVTTCTSSLVVYIGYTSDAQRPEKFDVTAVDNATHVTRDLIIKSAQLTDTGVYRCDEYIRGVIGSRQSASALLIVLGNY